jgi:hypothetical protein
MAPICVGRARTRYLCRYDLVADNIGIIPAPTRSSQLMRPTSNALASLRSLFG